MDLSDRNIRQRDIVPPEKLEKAVIVIVGVGAVGRQLALQLATMGVSNMTLIDPQDVDVENLGAQGFHEVDLGKKKTAAVKEVVRDINKNISVTLVSDYFRPRHLPEIETGQARAVFVCVDNMVARSELWQHAMPSNLYIDSRMSAEVARVITVSDVESEQYYPKTLFSDDEMYQESCTAKTTIYCASIQAGLLASQFTKWLRGMKLSMDMTVNLLSGDWDHDLVEEVKPAAC